MTKKLERPDRSYARTGEAELAMARAVEADLKYRDDCWVIQGKFPYTIIRGKFSHYTPAGATIWYYDPITDRHGPRIQFNWNRGDQVLGTEVQAKVMLLMALIQKESRLNIELSGVKARQKELVAEIGGSN